MVQLEEMDASQEECSRQQSFQFVDVIAGPTGKPRAAQRRVVRSNAARYQWSQTKSHQKTTANSSKKTTKTATNVTRAEDEPDNALKKFQVTRSTLLDQSASLSSIMLSLPGEDDCNLLKFSISFPPLFHQVILIPHRLRYYSPLSASTPPQRRREPSCCQMGAAGTFQPNSLPDMDEMRRYPP